MMTTTVMLHEKRKFNYVVLVLLCLVVLSEILYYLELI
jgi:hypothetical protein